MKENKEKNEIEFDPTESEEFYKNLELALTPAEPEPEKWKPTVEEDAAWIAISEPEAAAAEENAKADAETEKKIPATDADDEDLPELVLSDDLFRVDSGEESFQEKEPADEVLLGINAALAEQMEHEFGRGIFEEEKPKGKVAAFLATIPRWTKVLVTVMLTLIVGCSLLFGTKGGRGLIYRGITEFIFAKITTIPDNPDSPDTPDDPNYLVTITPAPTETVDPEATPVPTIAIPTGEAKDESVINILLIGEENIFGSSRGRADSIMLASLDKDGGPLKLVSFLRDLYVSIPGYPDDKLNAAYAHGGAKLLMETLEKNFKVDIDGYVIIDFSGFETIIDKLGGLEIELTKAESDYLNTTKYISKVEERNTVPGKQKMTGSQVLGYCRVRAVPTPNGLVYDFGRTYRQRLVLQKLFNKYKEKNIAELLSVMNTCFGYVKTQESLKTIAAECLQTVVENKMFELDTQQIPASGHFGEVKIAGKLVLTFYPDNRDILHDFLYQGRI